MYLSGMWLDVHPRMDTKRCVFIRNQTMCLECANHYMLNREHSWGEGGGPIQQFNEHKNLHFDNE